MKSASSPSWGLTEFIPFISEELLQQGLALGKKYHFITQQDIQTVMHCTKVASVPQLETLDENETIRHPLT